LPVSADAGVLEASDFVDDATPQADRERTMTAANARYNIFFIILFFIFGFPSNYKIFTVNDHRHYGILK
jgi:hypothetical protein